MFVTWLITISVFLIGIYTTITIFNGLNEKDQYDLAILHSQYKNINIHDNEIEKQLA